MRALTLSKHHGLANDFLVLLDLEGRVDTPPELARSLCDRRQGIGADGLITVRRADTGELRMELRNADGGIAEMSGNGIRCLAQAVELAGLVPLDGTLPVLTDAGVKRLQLVEPTGVDGVARWSVDMGPAKLEEPVGRDGVRVDMGNPHLVLPDDGQDLAALGAAHPDLNVELVRVDGDDVVTMRVWERGVGLTQACGTGSCATAAATHAWGLTGRSVTVRNPGGELHVELAPDTVVLTGPAQYVGRVEVPWR